jgi:hypothetical protein
MTRLAGTPPGEASWPPRLQGVKVPGVVAVQDSVSEPRLPKF